MHYLDFYLIFDVYGSGIRNVKNLSYLQKFHADGILFKSLISCLLPDLCWLFTKVETCSYAINLI